MHCRGHQKGKKLQNWEIDLLMKQKKRVAGKSIRELLPQKGIDLSEFTPNYDQRDYKLSSLGLKLKKAGGLLPQWDRL